MDPEVGNWWLWAIMDVALVTVLGAVMVFVVHKYRRRYRGETPQERSAQHDRRREEASREEAIRRS